MAHTIVQFLMEAEREALVALANTIAFEPGRQGTGYEKAAVDARTHPQIASILERSKRALEMAPEAGFDCYLLRYPPGSEIPPHRDDAPSESQHWRLNAVVMQPREGGELVIGGSRIELAVGDAVVFRPDAETHSVSRVNAVRLVWSVGTLRSAP